MKINWEVKNRLHIKSSEAVYGHNVIVKYTFQNILLQNSMIIEFLSWKKDWEMYTCLYKYFLKLSSQR